MHDGVIEKKRKSVLQFKFIPFYMRNAHMKTFKRFFIKHVHIFLELKKGS